MWRKTKDGKRERRDSVVFCLCALSKRFNVHMKRGFPIMSIVFIKLSTFTTTNTPFNVGLYMG